MDNNKINAIYYNDSEGSWVYCILDPTINGEEYVKKLNERVVLYNEDIQLYETKLSALNALHRRYASFQEITGSERLNEREPKYPSEKPKGFKNVQEACPEITLERERRRIVNEKNDIIYKDFLNDAINKVNIDIEPTKVELLEKWPEFKSWLGSYYSWARKIFYNFSLGKLNYVSTDLK